MTEVTKANVQGSQVWLTLKDGENFLVVHVLSKVGGKIEWEKSGTNLNITIEK